MLIKIPVLKGLGKKPKPSDINVNGSPKIQRLIDRAVLTVQLDLPEEQIWVDDVISAEGKKLVGNDIAQRTGYNSNYHVKLGPKDTACVFSFDPKFDDSGYVRADFNPRRLGYKGMVDFWAFVGGLSVEGICHIASLAKVTRLDIAYDLYGVDIQTLMIWSETSPTNRAYFRNGRIQTTYLGKRGSPKQVKMYDKNAELEAKGIPAWSDVSVTRVEVSLKDVSA